MNFSIFFFSIIIMVIAIYLISLNNGSSISNLNENENIDIEDTPELLTNDCEENFSRVFLDEIKSINNIDKIEENNEFYSNNYSLEKEPHIKDIIIQEIENDKIKLNISEDNYNLAFRINMLIDNGLNIHEIAKELGKGIREVDTIIKINRIKNNCNVEMNKKSNNE